MSAETCEPGPHWRQKVLRGVSSSLPNFPTNKSHLLALSSSCNKRRRRKRTARLQGVYGEVFISLVSFMVGAGFFTPWKGREFHRVAQRSSRL